MEETIPAAGDEESISEASDVAAEPEKRKIMMETPLFLEKQKKGLGHKAKKLALEKVKKSGEYREEFMREHNKNPEELASVLYPNGVWLNHSDETGVMSVKDVCKALCARFIMDMAGVGLKVDYVRSKRGMWDLEINPDARKGGRKGKLLYESRLQPPSKIHFFCSYCQESGRDFGLVANGRFKRDGWLAADKKIGPNTDVKSTDKGNYSLQIQEIYYHSCGCKDEGDTSSLKEYRERGYVLLSVPFPWIVGSTYDGVIGEVDSLPKTVPFVGPNLSKDEKRGLEEDRGVKLKLRKRGKAGQQPWKKGKALVTYGSLVNLGKRKYEFDDRAYLPLPGYPYHEVLTAEAHETSMARLYFVLLCRLGVLAETSPFVFDKESFKEAWNMDSGKKRTEVPFSGRWVENERCHLSMGGVSVLFGGTEWEVCKEGPIHQFCHTDFAEGAVGDKDRDVVPGSFVLPLTVDGRRVYVKDEEQVVDIPFASCLLLRGDQPHGEVTAKASMVRLNCVALHGHLDSAGVKRAQGVLGRASGRNCYLPPEHVAVYGKDELAKYIKGRYHELKRSVEVGARAGLKKWAGDEELARIVAAVEGLEENRSGSGENSDEDSDEGGDEDTGGEGDGDEDGSEDGDGDNGGGESSGGGEKESDGGTKGEEESGVEEVNRGRKQKGQVSTTRNRGGKKKARVAPTTGHEELRRSKRERVEKIWKE